MAEEGGTYLEDFLLSLEHIPNDIRRDFELMKELDRESMELNKELTELENDYYANAQKIFASETSEEERKELIELNALMDPDMAALKERAHQKISEKIAIATNIASVVERYCKKLDTDLAFFETDLRGCGEFETPKGAEPGSEVAFTLKQDDQSMFLGRVIFHHVDTGEYDIMDVDDSSKHQLPGSQVIVLDAVESQRKLSKGDHVFALYPDTTSFYLAVVVQSSRRSSMNAEPTALVQFFGDEDATGVIPAINVPLKYIVWPPNYS